MTPRVFHPCQFNFADQDIRVDGATLSGGQSLSGYEDTIGTDGGGAWVADFAGADFGDRDDEGRAATLAWRALNAGMAGGSVAVVVSFCDRLHQPVVALADVPHSDGSPFSDDALYQTSGASAVVFGVINGQAGGNRATIIDIALTSGRALIGGERFTHVHPTWGERAYEISAVEPIAGGLRVAFQPPIRGGIQPGDDLDFDNIRCWMHRTSRPTNALSMGAFSSASITFAEYMRRPA